MHSYSGYASKTQKNLEGNNQRFMSSKYFYHEVSITILSALTDKFLYVIVNINRGSVYSKFIESARCIGMTDMAHTQSLRR